MRTTLAVSKLVVLKFMGLQEVQHPTLNIFGAQLYGGMNLIGGTLTSTAVSTTTCNATTFNGTNGFTITNFTTTTAGVALIFQALEIYTVTGALTFTGTSASNITMTSSSGSDLVSFILQIPYSVARGG